MAAAILALTVRQYKPELAIQVSLAAGVCLLIMITGELTGILDTVRNLSVGIGVDSDWISLVLRAMGIGYLAQLSAQICRDAGEGALAMKAELCGRVLILAAALPYVIELVTTLTGLIGEAL